MGITTDSKLDMKKQIKQVSRSVRTTQLTLDTLGELPLSAFYALSDFFLLILLCNKLVPGRRDQKYYTLLKTTNNL